MSGTLGDCNELWMDCITFHCMRRFLRSFVFVRFEAGNAVHTAMKTTIAASGAVLEQNLTHVGTSEGDAISIRSLTEGVGFFNDCFPTVRCLQIGVGTMKLDLLSKKTFSPPL